jgi:23S rRNA (guanine745-N1)-methyltransferase
VLAEVAAALRCPVCELALGGPIGGAMKCPRGHSFDIARQGHLSLMRGSDRPGGDTAAMVTARAAFLAGGQYDPITAALVEEAVAAAPADGLVVDVGAGTGHHLARVLDALPGRIGLAIDRSTVAARTAARAHERMGSIACDAWGPLPLIEGVAGLVLTVFAPRNGPETARILRTDGAVLVVAPTERHLREIVAPLELLKVEPGKRARLADQLAPVLVADGEREVEWTMRLDHEAVARLVAMGPSAHHVEPGSLERAIAALPDPVAVTASVTVARFRPAGAGDASLLR